MALCVFHLDCLSFVLSLFIYLLDDKKATTRLWYGAYLSYFLSRKPFLNIWKQRFLISTSAVRVTDEYLHNEV